MAIVKPHDLLSQSFMLLSFVTAALLLAVQGFNLGSQQNNTASAPESPSDTLPFSEQPASSLSPASEAAQLGIEATLASAFHPVALIRQSRLVVDLSDRQVTLHQNDAEPVVYGIAVGRAGWETPTGEFRVLSLQKNPIWQNPLSGEIVSTPEENPLGSRWIGFWIDGTHQIGFHGTNQEELIGQAVSHGCIRMRDADIQALFTQVAMGTPVTVQP